jgi:hypothetical protein
MKWEVRSDEMLQKIAGSTAQRHGEGAYRSAAGLAAAAA